jgi:hypothetical protein
MHYNSFVAMLVHTTGFVYRVNIISKAKDEDEDEDDEEMDDRMDPYPSALLIP